MSTTSTLGRQRFLSAGDRVKVVIQFREEMQHKDLGRELLEKIYKPIETTRRWRVTRALRTVHHHARGTQEGLLTVDMLDNGLNVLPCLKK